jgi:hypothetical protein
LEVLKNYDDPINVQGHEPQFSAHGAVELCSSKIVVVGGSRVALNRVGSLSALPGTYSGGLAVVALFRLEVPHGCRSVC